MAFRLLLSASAVSVAGTPARLYTVETWYKSKPSWAPPDRNEWLSWRVASIDPASGLLQGEGPWSCCSDDLLHPSGGGTHARAAALLYSGFTSGDARNQLMHITTEGDAGSFDVQQKKGDGNVFFAANSDTEVRLADRNDGFNYLLSRDDDIANQISMYEFEVDTAQTSRPAALKHISTLTMNKTGDDVSPFEDYAIGVGCGITMYGGCNEVSTLLYVVFDGHLFEISRLTGKTLQRIDLGKGLSPTGSDSFAPAHVFVPLGGNPPSRVEIAGLRGGGATMEVWSVPLARGAAQEPVKVASFSKPGTYLKLAGCGAYDHEARMWYLGCDPIVRVENQVDDKAAAGSWKVLGMMQVKHPDAAASAQSKDDDVRWDIRGLQAFVNPIHPDMEADAAGQVFV